jgi:hypothetical protein
MLEHNHHSGYGTLTRLLQHSMSRRPEQKGGTYIRCHLIPYSASALPKAGRTLRFNLLPTNGGHQRDVGLRAVHISILPMHSWRSRPGVLGIPFRIAKRDSRMPWIYGFAVVLCLCWRTIAIGRQSNQIPFKASGNRKGQVFTPEFSAYVGRILEEHKVSGLSLAVVQKDGTLELGAWGNKTEDGAHMTPDVSVSIRNPRTHVIEQSCRLCIISDQPLKRSRPPLLES